MPWSPRSSHNRPVAVVRIDRNSNGHHWSCVQRKKSNSRNTDEFLTCFYPTTIPPHFPSCACVMLSELQQSIKGLRQIEHQKDWNREGQRTKNIDERPKMEDSEICLFLSSSCLSGCRSDWLIIIMFLVLLDKQELRQPWIACSCSFPLLIFLLQCEQNNKCKQASRRASIVKQHNTRSYPSGRGWWSYASQHSSSYPCSSNNKNCTDEFLTFCWTEQLTDCCWLTFPIGQPSHLI